jgi:putative ABC transport system permease protein
MNAAAESFIPFYGMRLLAGRNLHHTDSLQEIIINEAAVRAFGFATPQAAVGKMLEYESGVTKRAVPIVGVVADYHTESFRDPIRATVIGHWPGNEKFVGIRLALAGKHPGELTKIIEALRAAYKTVYHVDDPDYSFMDDTIQTLYRDELRMSLLVRSAMVLQILISSMGLFGVSLFAAERRKKEIGIRKVLGANVGNLVLLLSKEFIGLVMLAFLIASPIAWWAMSRWLNGFAYRIPLSLSLFLMAGLCGIAIAILTVSYQTTRVARANPVESLKTE